MIKKQLRKSFFARFMTLLVLALMSTVNVWGEEVTFTGAAYNGKGGASGTGGAATATIDDITISSTKAYYNSDSEIREYKNGTLTVSCSEGNITSIVFTCTGNKYACFTASKGLTTSGSTQTWTGSEQSVTFTASAQSRWSKIVVSYTPTGSGPSINASGITIEADETLGAIDYTINNPVEGKKLTANSDALWISDVTVTDTQVTFTTKKNETGADRTANVYLNYEGAKEKTVTVTQKKAIPTYASLADLVEAGEPTEEGVVVKVTLTDEVIKDIYITSKGYKNGIFIQVGEQEIEIFCYDVPDSWIPGGKVSGTLTCTWQKYGDTWELCPDKWDYLIYTAPAGAYKVNISKSIEHGTVTANPTEGVEGAQITLTATPDEGYKFESYTVKDAADNNITVTDGKFAMPANDVTVSATFVEKPQYTVAYMSLGAKCGEETVREDDCIADAPVVNTPDGWMWQFAGWTANASYADDTTAPEFVTDTTPITSNTTLYAVFSKKEKSTDGKEAYVKVTENQEDWSGTYLIVFEGAIVNDKQVEPNAFDGNLSELDAASNFIPVTIYDNEIAVDNTTKDSYFTITKVGDSYKITSASNSTIGHTGTKNTLNTGAELTNTISLNPEIGNVEIVSGEATLQFNANSGQSRYRYYTSAGQKPIYLYKKSGATESTYSLAPTYTREGLTVGNFGTICLPYATTATTGAKFYSIAGKNMEEGGNLTTVKSISLNEVEGELKAGVAYIFQATDATLTAIYSGNYASPVPAEDNNGLEGVFTEQNIDVSVTSQIYYVISGKNIYYVNSNVKVPAYRACIWMGSVPESSGAKADIEIINGDMPTAINGVNVEIAPTAVNYNIAGQKVNKNYKGVVISNGKKYVVK